MKKNEVLQTICRNFSRLPSLIESEREIADNYFRRIYTQPKTADLLFEIITNPSQIFQKEHEAMACYALKCFISYQKAVPQINSHLFLYMIKRIHHFLLVLESNIDDLCEIYSDLIMFTNSNDPFLLEQDVLIAISNPFSANIKKMFKILECIVDIYASIFVDKIEAVNFYHRFCTAVSNVFTEENISKLEFLGYNDDVISIFCSMQKDIWFLCFLQEPTPITVISSIIFCLATTEVSCEMIPIIQSSSLFFKIFVKNIISSNFFNIQNIDQNMVNFFHQFLNNIVNASFRAACKVHTYFQGDIIAQSALIGIVLDGFDWLYFTPNDNDDPTFRDIFQLALSFCEFRQVNYMYYDDNPDLFYDLAFSNSTSTNCELRGAAVGLVEKICKKNLSPLIFHIMNEDFCEPLMRFVSTIANTYNAIFGNSVNNENEDLDFLKKFFETFMDRAMSQNFNSQIDYSSYIFLAKSCIEFLSNDKQKFFADLTLNHLMKNENPVIFTLATELLVKLLKSPVTKNIPMDDIARHALSLLDYCLNFSVLTFVAKVVKNNICAPDEFIPDVVSIILNTVITYENLENCDLNSPLQNNNTDISSNENFFLSLKPFSLIFKNFIKFYPQSVPFDKIFQFIQIAFFKFELLQNYNIKISNSGEVSFVSASILPLLKIIIQSLNNDYIHRLLSLLFNIVHGQELSYMFRFLVTSISDFSKYNIQLLEMIFNLTCSIFNNANDPIESICAADTAVFLINNIEFIRLHSPENFERFHQHSLQILNAALTLYQSNQLEDPLFSEAAFSVVAAFYKSFHQIPDQHILQMLIDYVQTGKIARACDSSLYIKALNDIPNLTNATKEMLENLHLVVDQYSKSLNENQLQLLNSIV